MTNRWVIRKWNAGRWVYLAGLREHKAMRLRTYTRKASKSASWTRDVGKARQFDASEQAAEVVRSQRLSSGSVIPIPIHLEVSFERVTR